MYASVRPTLRCESLLGFTPAALPRLDGSENPRTWLGPEFFRNLLARSLGSVLYTGVRFFCAVTMRARGRL
jgi:hypothetical protein